jgi:hypothetical protein
MYSLKEIFLVEEKVVEEETHWTEIPLRRESFGHFTC